MLERAFAKDIDLRGLTKPMRFAFITHNAGVPNLLIKVLLYDLRICCIDCTVSCRLCFPVGNGLFSCDHAF